jgi:archaellum component FlaC
MKNKNTTIEDLAVMVKRGFDETAQGMNERFDGVDQRFDIVDNRLGAIEGRLDKIEKLILADHKRRIEKLEDEVKDLKGLLLIK